MEFSVGRPFVKAMDSARYRLQSWRSASFSRTDFRSVETRNPNSDFSGGEIERLLADLPATAFKGRQLSAASEAVGRALVGKFQSIGRDCEFGFVQRRFGVEPLDLFRFAAVAPDRLAVALESRLAELQKLENLALEFDGEFEHGQPQMAIVVQAYGFRFHAGNLPPHMSFDAITSIQLKKLKLLTRKFFDDLADGERVFVCKCDAAAEPQVKRLAEAMRHHGPTDILWVTLKEHDKPAGTVERISEGLMRGYIEGFAPAWRISMFSAPIWLKLCCDAYRLHLASRMLVSP